MSQLSSPLSERVQTAIVASPYLVGRKLRFDTEDGCVTLRGTVNSFFQKQMAQEAVRRVDGVEEISNDLEVSWR